MRTKRRPRGPGGRPPLPAEKRRAERIMVNLSEAEREALERQAGGTPVSVYVRDLILRHLARRRS